MDLLFNRYASPFLILEQMIEVGRFSEFVDEFIKIKNEETEAETLWEQYLHHPFLEIDFETWKRRHHITDNHPKQKNIDFETTIKKSANILKNFIPEEEGDKNGII